MWRDSPRCLRQPRWGPPRRPAHRLWRYSHEGAPRSDGDNGDAATGPKPLSTPAAAARTSPGRRPALLRVRRLLRFDGWTVERQALAWWTLADGEGGVTWTLTVGWLTACGQLMVDWLSTCGHHVQSHPTPAPMVITVSCSRQQQQPAVAM